MMFPKPNHQRRVPKRSKRGEFSKEIRTKIFENENHCCQMCGGKATQIHHVMPRGRSGRGVITNGMAICNGCHTLIHKDNELLNHWIGVYTIAFGKDFYKDEWD